MFMIIFGVLVGIYSFAHPLLMAFMFGVLIGICFIESGIHMVVMEQCFKAE